MKPSEIKSEIILQTISISLESVYTDELIEKEMSNKILRLLHQFLGKKNSSAMNTFEPLFESAVFNILIGENKFG